MESDRTILSTAFSNRTEPWFGGSMGIRVHDLPLNITKAIQQIVCGLDEAGIILFANTLRKIWKERNKAVIEHYIFKPQEVLKRITASLRQELQQAVLIQNNNQLMRRYEVCQDGWQVLMDASWEMSGKTWCVFLLYEKGMLHSIGMHSCTVQDAFHAEAVALMEAMTYVYDKISIMPDARVQLFSDYLNLVMAVHEEDARSLPSWRAERLVNQIIVKMNAAHQGSTLYHARREAIVQAHELANIARRTNARYQGPPHMALQQQQQSNGGLDERYF